MLFNKPSCRWIGLFLFFPFFLFSQNIDRCHSDEKMDALIQADPAYKKALKNDQPASAFAFRNSQVVVTIPVHVIIVHPPGQAVGTGVNFSVPHIQSQIDVLNEDFRRLNSDAGNTPSVFPAADSEIEFCLASTDPSGNPTDGITRYGTNQNLSNNENSIKSATGWDRNTYLNFWVGDGLGGILGWAYLPSTNGLPNATLDGVVVASCSFGGPGYGSCSPYNLGRTGTHEVGHYLGLRHVWGNGGCNSDDNIADTPIQSSSNFGCPSHPSPSCNNGGDMFMNYMDYVRDNCMNAFTAGQNARMHTILNNSRSSLLNAAAAVCSGSQGVPLALSLTSQTNVSCNGGSDGSLTVDAIGGTGNFVYTINNGPPQSNNTFTNLSASTYIVEVDDGNNSISINVTITQPPVLIPVVSSQVDVDCAGNSNGIIFVSATGGTNNTGVGYLYDFNGSGYSPNNVFTNLSGGVYTLTVQDENLCVSSIPVIINEPNPINSFITNQVSIDCASNNTGEVTIGSIGGTPNYLYALNGGNYTPNNIFTNLSVGSYSMETIDVQGCTHSFLFDVTEPPALQLSLVQETDLDCFGEMNGLIEVSAQGGTTGYQYAINNGNYQASPVFSSLSGGTYNVAVQDVNGCVETLSVDIDEPAELVASISNQTNVDCFGGNTGSITIDVSGGTGTPSILFNGNTMTGNSVTFDNLTAGTYSYVVTDGNNCQVISSVDVSENNEVDLLLTTSQNVNCNGQSNGLIEVQSSGGNGNFTYFLNSANQGNNNVFTNLTGGTYLVETMDGLGCTDQLIIDIIEPPVLQVSLSQQTNLNCFGDNNGAVSISANGGNGNLQYSLGSETNATGDFNNLSAGFYTVTVFDNNNCVNTLGFEITQPTELLVQETNNVAVDCFGNNTGSLQVSANGGASNYQFSNGTENNTTGIFNNLTAGTYSISVTDGNNCQTIIQSTIAQPAELIANITSQQDVNCFGENSGSIDLDANGGNGNITFTLNGNTNSTGDFSNLTSGTYSIVVADQNSCQTTVQVIIDEPTDLNLVIDNVTNASCAGQEGNVQLSANGGTGGYQFTLGSTTNSTGYFEGLSGGNYSVQVQDNNMCTETISVDIFEPTTLSASVSQSQNINCFGGNEGSVQVDASGGFGDLTFTLGNETNATGFFQNLAAGNYNVVVEDANNCTSTVQVEITQPAELIANIASQQNVNCFGENSGSINLEANGGNGNITFTLNGNSNSTGDFSNLSSGTYSILVADQNSCQTTVEVTLDEPTPLNLVIENVTDASCDGAEGSIQLSANGGTGGYQYTLGNESNSTGFFEGLGGGNYSIEVTDNNNCTANLSVEITEPSSLSASISQIQNVNCFGGNTGSAQVAGNGGIGDLTFTLGNETNNSGAFENLPAGNYQVTLEDANNCTSTVDVIIEQPAELILIADQIGQVNCFEGNDGMVNLSNSGGTGAVEFSLNGQTNSTGVFENLPTGNYTFSIIDGNGCTDDLQIEITSPDEINTQILSSQNISCAGNADGMAQISASGGAGGFEYSLGNQTNSTGIFEGISAGIYLVEIVDANNCMFELPMEFTEPAAIVFENIQSQAVNCNGDENGFFQVQANGGTGNLTYTLGSETNTTGQFSNLAAGTYLVMATDANNCSTTTSIEIDEPAPIQVTFEDIADNQCFGDETGMIDLGSTGGVGAVEFTLNNETNTTGLFENLPAGFYQVELQDANSCVTNINITINQPAPVVLESELLTAVNCFGGSDGALQINAEGGVGNYTYELNNNSNTSGLFENLSAGNYEFLVSDGNGCQEMITVSLSDPAEIQLEIINTTTTGCNGNATGTAQVQATNGVGGFTYEMNGENNTTGIFENLASGVYDLTATDGNGCVVNMSVPISEENDIQVETTWSNNVNCFAEEDGEIHVQAVTSSGTLSFELDGMTNSTGDFINLPAGNYNVVITDGNGCSMILPFEITEPAELNLMVTDLQNVNCFGAATGTVNLSATGGNNTFTYTVNGESNDSGAFENLPAGIYNAEVMDGNGCLNNLSITVSEPDELLISTTDLTVDFGNNEGSATLVGQGGVEPFTYSLNGIDFQDENIFGNLAAGNYDGFIQDANGCISQTSFTIEMETGITNPDLGVNRLEILPNPFSEFLFLNIELEFAQNIELEMWTISGKEVYQKTIHLQNGNHQLNLEPNQNLPAGSYILRVKNEKGSIGYFKLIKQK